MTRRPVSRALRMALRRLGGATGLVDPLPDPDAPRTFVVDADWDTSYRYFPGEATTERLKEEQPGWEPPPAAKRDPWRPRSTFGE